MYCQFGYFAIYCNVPGIVLVLQRPNQYVYLLLFHLAWNNQQSNNGSSSNSWSQSHSQPPNPNTNNNNGSTSSGSAEEQWAKYHREMKEWEQKNAEWQKWQQTGAAAPSTNTRTHNGY